MNRSRRLFLFPFEHHRSTEGLLKSALNAGFQPEQIIYLTPSPRKLRATQVLLFQMLGKKALISPMFRTVGQLAREICEYTSSCRYLSNELKPLVIRRLAQQRGREITLGYAQVISRFIADVKKHVAPEAQPAIPQILSDLLAGYEKPRRRALEAYELMCDYNRLLEEHHWLDQEDLIRHAAQSLDKFADLPPVLILDCFVAPNLLEQQLLSGLIECCPVVIAGTYWSETAPEKYHLARRFIDFILRQPGFSTETFETDLREKPPSQLYRFPTPEREVIGVCREICRRSLGSGLGETYVVFPRLSPYAPLVVRHFSQYHIPYSIFPSSPLNSSPVITPVLELLRALDTDYERIATAAAFSSPYLPGLLRLPEDADLSPRNRAAELLNILSRRAGIIKDRNSWWNIAERIINDENQPQAALEITLLRDIQKRVRQAIGLTESILEPAGTMGNQARRLKQFLETVNYGANLDPDAEYYPELDGDRKSFYDILDAISELDAELGGQDEPRRLFIRTLLHLMASGVKSPERDQGGVMVMEMEETLGLNPGNLFFCGLCEGDLPGTYQPDPILPDSIRRRLGMPDIEWHRDWQRFHFWRVLSSSPAPPFLSFAESRDGRPELPSPFVELEAVRYTDCQIIFSDVEEQLYEGRRRQIRLETVQPAVDFTADETVKKVLNERFGPNYCFHITMLENYLYCPFRFYLEHVLRLILPAEPVFELDARSWGTVAHQVLARLYQKGDVPLNELQKRAQQITNDVLKKMEIPEFWRQVTERVMGNLVNQLVVIESQLRETGFYPEWTETHLRGTLDNISLQGRIDRIDRRAQEVRIIDYKTGSQIVRAKDVLAKKSHLQLPMYAHLLLQNQKFSGLSVENMAIYNLREMSLNLIADDRSSVEQLISAARDTVREIVRAIRSGNFVPTKVDKQHCRSCEFSFTCGADDNNNESESSNTL